MENTSKALLIAGGVLISIMVVSLLVIGYNSLTDYQRTKQNALSEEQLVAFNKQYEAYNRDLTGFEMVSLLNKIIDYNKLNTVSSDSNDWENNNTSKGYTEMYIKFTIKDSEIRKLFIDGTYDSANSTKKDKLDQIRSNMQSLEHTYGTTLMSKLSAMSDYNPETEEGKIEIIKKLGVNVLPKSLPEIEEVKKYQHYIEFKRANFKCTGTEYDKNTGRIIKLIYEQI
ncbi:MAG: hypothetical protein IKF17_06090 [Clostridia bacterium]|nr:hypothetical protein [Clostridia bacterium]